MHLNEFMYDEKIEPTTVLLESRKIQKEQRQVNREELILVAKAENEEKARIRQEEKNGRMFTKVGKTVMHRSNKPELMRVKEVKTQLTEEQIDMKKYLFTKADQAAA
jgi:hypothetical protein